MSDIIFAELNRLYDDAGIPKIVRETCPYCDGIGERVRDAHGLLWDVQRCTACAGNGYISVESR